MRFLDTSRIRTRFDERVPALDGTELSVDLYLPPQPGRYPVLLNRTPADNNRPGRAGISLPPAERWKALAAQGYIIAAADVRGRGDSNGQFTPFVHEGSDGAATLSWLRQLDECNGKIGLFGSGYGAFCAWAAAVADGHVNAIASISPMGAVGKTLVHRDGAVRLDWLFWMHLIGGRTVQPANVPAWSTIYKHWPLRAMGTALGRSDIWWESWLDHLDPADPFWRALDLADSIAALNAPGLHVTGWWDGYRAATYYYFEAACRSAAPQLLVVGPWDAAAVQRPTHHVGGFDFGPRALVDLDEMLAQFFDAHLGSDTGSNTEVRPAFIAPTQSPRRSRATAVQLFVTGRNEWTVGTERWLNAPSTWLDLYLTSMWGANTRRGDGVLSETPPSQGGVDSVTHNPQMPVEFQPQFAGFAAGAKSPELVLDQAHLTSRDEALVYTSTALQRRVTVIGRPKVTLVARTDAPDADLYVLLSDTFPLGTRDLHLSHAAIRLATLATFSPGVPLTVDLELDAVAHDFLPGHQIRLTVTPSLYPLYARNPHVEGYIFAREPAIADIEMHHGPQCTALLALPVARLDADTGELRRGTPSRGDFLPEGPQF